MLTVKYKGKGSVIDVGQSKWTKPSKRRATLPEKVTARKHELRSQVTGWSEPVNLDVTEVTPKGREPKVETLQYRSP